MKKFELNDYFNGKKYIINTRLLMIDYGISERNAHIIIQKLKKQGTISKIRAGQYVLTSFLTGTNKVEIAQIIDPEAYVSLYSVLEKGVIKQGFNGVYLVSPSRDVKNKELCEKFNIQFFKTKINDRFGLYYSNGISVADNERALLDLIYLHIFAKLPIVAELYLGDGKINDDKIREYLKHYPAAVSNFYNKKLKSYEKQ